MRNRPPSRWVRLVAIAQAVLLLLLLVAQISTCATHDRRSRVCVRVVDGDTIVLDGGERVRLIGVDTPESVDPRRPVEWFGKEASAFTRRLVEGRRVRLEYDRTRRDVHRRTLAYVYLEDGTFVNLEIVRRGYGHAYTRFPFRYLEQFRAAERQARAERAGLWAGR